MLDLVVVGAGPAGLAHAFWRRRAQPALRLAVVERAPEPGGHVQTRRSEGFSCEVGPQGFRMTDAARTMITALGLQDDVVAADAAAALRFVGRGGRLLPMPRGPLDLLRTPLLGFGGKLRLLCEPFVRRRGEPDESLAAFAGRRLGRQTVPLADTFVSGIFAGDAAALEVASAFPLLARLEREHGSLFAGARALRKERRGGPPAEKKAPLYTFRGGMGDLVQALRRQLGNDLRLGRAAVAISRDADGHVVTLGGEVPATLHARELALAVPAHAAAPLLGPLDAGMAAELAAIPYAGVANVWLGFAEDEARERMTGTGFLLDPGEDSPVLGAIYVSSLFPQRTVAGKHLVRVMLGGVRHADVLQLDDEALLRSAEETLRRYTGVRAPVVFRRVVKVPQAIPQFVRGHAARLARLRERLLLRHPGLFLLGNSYREVAMVGQLGPDPALP